MGRASPHRSNRGAPDAHTIWSPSPYFARHADRAPCGCATSRVHTGPVQDSDAVGRQALLVEVDDAAPGPRRWRLGPGRDVAADESCRPRAPCSSTASPTPTRCAAALARLGAGGARPPSPATLVEVPVTYDGADLAFVAEHWGDDARTRWSPAHAAIEYVAAFCGFAPGFAYLSGCPSERAVPRLDTPRSAGAGRVGGAGRTVVRRLPDRVARAAGGSSARTDAVLWDADPRAARAAAAGHPGAVRAPPMTR